MHGLQGRGPCPFFLSREMADSAEILFMPYQYLLDGRTRATLNNIPWENSVVIFDEAHNVEVQGSLAAFVQKLPARLPAAGSEGTHACCSSCMWWP